jgi:hypothetical protein
MKPSQLKDFLVFATKNRFPVLIKGKPGIGKSDIVEQATQETSSEMVISHPVVSDPTDYKGLPFADAASQEAHFLPYGDLNKLIKATKPLTYFIDDIGQAPASVQAAVMQLLLARRINGHKVSEFVTFVAATNRREDRAGVTGILAPVKSRFMSIVELEVNTDDWVQWALQNNMPIELIAFMRFRPDLLDTDTQTKDIENTPSPRTVASVGKWQKQGLASALEFEVIKGAAGEAFATEYCAFLRIYRNLPSIDEMILNPMGAPVPTDPATLYAITGLIAGKANDNNVGPLLQYAGRLPGEINVAAVKDMTIRKRELMNTAAYVKWASDNSNVIL